MVYTVVASFLRDARGAILSKTATVSGSAETNSANDSASDTDSADVQYDVSVTKTNGTTTVVPGATTTYTITVSNAGPSTATSDNMLMESAISLISCILCELNCP